MAGGSFPNKSSNLTVQLAGATPIVADVSGWGDQDRGIGIGTDDSTWFMFKYGAELRAVELTVYPVPMGG